MIQVSHSTHILMSLLEVASPIGAVQVDCVVAIQLVVGGHDMMHRSVLIIYDQQFIIARITW